MRYILRRLALFLVVVAISSCATWNPQLGMSYQEFMQHWTKSDNWTKPEFVGAQGSIRVYESNGVYYYFENGRLAKADQGQLYEQRIRISID